jgi:hypothetical protein
MVSTAKLLGIVVPPTLHVESTMRSNSGTCPFMAQIGHLKEGRACPLCPCISDINLFRYCQASSTSAPRYRTVLSILKLRSKALRAGFNPEQTFQLSKAIQLVDTAVAERRLRQ